MSRAKDFIEFATYGVFRSPYPVVIDDPIDEPPRMLDQMELLLSFCSGPLPLSYTQSWDYADEVHDLAASTLCTQVPGEPLKELTEDLMMRAVAELWKATDAAFMRPRLRTA